MREKVGKSQNTLFFQWFAAPEGRKVGSLKRRVRSQLARWVMKNCTPLWREAHFEVKMYKTHQVRTTFGRWDVKKVHAVVVRSTFQSQNVQNTPGPDHFGKLRCRKSACRCGAKHISKSKCTKHTSFGPLLESWDVEKVHAVVARSTFPSQNVQNTTCSCHFWRFGCWKKCTLLWREAHFEVKMYKAPHVRATFGGSDVEKVHAVVARSTFPSQNVKNTRGSDHLWRFRCRCASRHYTTLHSATLHYTTLHYITLHHTTFHHTSLHYTPLHYNYTTTPHYTPLHYITLHHTTLHYTTLPSTTLHYSTLHYTPLHYKYNYTTTQLHNYIPLHSTTLNYTTLHSTTLHYTTLHNTSTKTTQLHNYTPLNYTTLHYITLHYLPLHFTTLHYTTATTTTTKLHSTTLNYTTQHYTTLHYIPLHSTTLHYITLHCITLNDIAPQIDR